MRRNLILDKLDGLTATVQTLFDTVQTLATTVQTIVSKLAEHDKRFDAIDDQLDFLATESYKHGEDIKVIKEDVRTVNCKVDVLQGTVGKLNNDVVEWKDYTVTQTSRLDQERLIMHDRLNYHEKKINALELIRKGSVL